MSFDAVVLAGGGGRRLDGADKAALVVGGIRLLDRVLTAVEGAGRIVVVGPQRESRVAVRWCREEPVGGGPVAALAAALPIVTAERVVTLAVDLPFVAPAVPLLLEAVADAEVSVLVDLAGRRNLLAAAWRTDALRVRVGRLPPAGGAVRSLFADAVVREVVDHGGYGRDCDTPADLAAARAASLNGAP